MKKKLLLVICFLFYSIPTWSLVPLEGIIFGDVRNFEQYDPFVGMLSYNYSVSKNNENDVEKMKFYQALYKQGYELESSCRNTERLRYSNSWYKFVAAKSVAATLQYIGIDITVRAIAAYAKKLELNEEQYSNLVHNLTTNSCSQNISVYSIDCAETFLSFLL